MTPREALLAAARVCEAIYREKESLDRQHHSSYYEGCTDTAEECERAILALAEQEDRNLTPENQARIEDTFRGLVSQHFDCHYNGEPSKCDKDCAQLGYCKRRTSEPALPGPETVSVPRDVVVAAERKLRLVASIYPGDKESRRLADELLAAVSAK